MISLYIIKTLALMCPSPVTSNRLKAVSMNLDQRVKKILLFLSFLDLFGVERRERRKQ